MMEIHPVLPLCCLIIPKTILALSPSPFYQERIIDFNGHQWLLAFDAIPYTLKLDFTDAWITLFGGNLH